MQRDTTWAHETRGPARRCRHFTGGSKTKVGDENINVSAFRRYEDVLQLKVPVINAAFMAVTERINDLEEDVLDEFIFAEKRGFLDDRVKIAGAKIVYEEGVRALVDLAMEGEHVGMGRYTGMKLPLASQIILASPLNTFDCILYAGVGVEGAIYDAELPRTQNSHDDECAVIDDLTQELGCRLWVRHGWWGLGGCWKQPSPVTGSSVVWWRCGRVVTRRILIRRVERMSGVFRVLLLYTSVGCMKGLGGPEDLM